MRNRFFCLGINHLDDDIHDAETAHLHLQNWHFNSIGYSGNASLCKRWPYFKRLSFGCWNQWRQKDDFAYDDIFDSDFRQKLDQYVEWESRHLQNDANLIGIMWTDLPQWGLELARSQKDADWVSFIRSLPAHSAGRQAYSQFLLKKHGTVEAINGVYGTQFTSPDTLSAGDWSSAKLDHPESIQDDIDFLGHIAARHYGDITSALKRHCPDLLSFGDTYWASDLPETVLREAAKYIDVLSIQFGPEKSPFPGSGYEATFDIDFFRHLHELTGKPVLLADHAISFPDPEYKQTLWHQEPSQELAASAYKAFVEQAAKAPFIVGYARCMYQSQYSEWRNTLKQGLLDLAGKPYEPYCGLITEAHRQAQMVFRNRL